jgi:hypothetical protein
MQIICVEYQGVSTMTLFILIFFSPIAKLFIPLGNPVMLSSNGNLANAPPEPV